ncbi:MAG: phenylalanine--tRNA ligase subunit alpha [Rickettsiales bacterium]
MNLDAILQTALTAIAAAQTTAELEALRVQYLGKNGEITAQMKMLGTLPPGARKEAGAAINKVKDETTAALDAKKTSLEATELDARLSAETLDVTLPAAPVAHGSIHPITQVTEELIAIFSDFGFTVAEGPEIEDDFHNFTALNIPETHPARQMHDTFYLRGGDSGLPTPPLRGSQNRPLSDFGGGNNAETSPPPNPQADLAPPQGGSGNPAPPLETNGRPVLRTHTSPVQIRTMMSQKPPIRIIAPGTTYRSDSDMTHTPMFHQIEGLVIDKTSNMGHLKGLLHDALAAFFGLEKVPMRFRASFFPFTEPSAEVDIGCKRGKGELVIGEGSDWLEVAGCGMVHPNVLKNCGLDPAEWQGFAFGCGIERLAMLKYNIPDLRTMFAGDMRWLEHYGFGAGDVPSLVKGVGA